MADAAQGLPAPKDFPPKETVWQQFRRWRDGGTLEAIRLALNRKVRQKAGRAPLPSVVIADSQSVKTTEKGGSAATMAGRRSPAGSATSWSIRSA